MEGNVKMRESSVKFYEIFYLFYFNFCNLSMVKKQKNCFAFFFNNYFIILWKKYKKAPPNY